MLTRFANTSDFYVQSTAWNAFATFLSVTSEVENVPLSHTLQIILQFLVY